MTVILTNTKVPRSTKDLVAKVRKFLESNRETVTPIFKSMDSIAKKFVSLAEKGSSELIDETGFLMDLNHQLLCSLCVSHESLEKIYDESKKHGHFAKLTGAGGGGCALTLVNNKNSSTLEDLKVALR